MELMVFIIMVCAIVLAGDELLTLAKYLRGKLSKGAAIVADKTSEKPNGKK